MKALIDPDILVRHDAKKKPHRDTEKLYLWLGKAGYEKCISAELEERLSSFPKSKEARYCVLAAERIDAQVDAVGRRLDNGEADILSTGLLNLLYLGKADILITDNATTYTKAQALGISDNVFSISAFLEKCYSEHPEWVDYKVLSVRRRKISEINIDDPFFDSLKESYSEFVDWFIRKSNEYAYVSTYKEAVLAFLYLKIEGVEENYAEITPAFPKKRRLKIGTFKVEATGFKLGERFLKIVFDNAIRFGVDEIYVTVFDKDDDTRRLIKTLAQWGFDHWGVKTTQNGSEQVFVRSMERRYDIGRLRASYPYFSRSARAFLVPIYPDYHTDLLPDSVLRNEDASDFEDSEPHRNAISKVYVSRSYERDINPGDVILFYRTGGFHKSVVTTVGIVEEVVKDIADGKDFVKKCRKRSVFTDAKLIEHWDRNKANRPFIVNFLSAYTFPHRMNLAALIDAGIIKDVDSAPRGFQRISREQFDRLIKGSQTDEKFVVE